jgi:hypothetical protein
MRSRATQTPGRQRPRKSRIRGPKARRRGLVGLGTVAAMAVTMSVTAAPAAAGCSGELLTIVLFADCADTTPVIIAQQQQQQAVGGAGGGGAAAGGSGKAGTRKTRSGRRPNKRSRRGNRSRGGTSARPRRGSRAQRGASDRPKRGSRRQQHAGNPQ